VVPVSPLPVVTQPATLNIPSDLVFPFASYSLNDAVGGVQIRQRLEQFLKESGIKEVESVVVKGHSDPIGQPHRKELVSGERAKAVAAYVTRELNLSPAKVKAQAMSDRELLVSNCPVKPVAQRDACNAPNRRVELVVTGRR
jgi:OOP family OmpA-OmpF porin